MVHEVTRTFGAEFIILDIIFCILWMAFLIRKKYFLQWLIGLFGAIVVFLFDYVFWYTIKGTREIYSLPDFFMNLGEFWGHMLFLIYFSFTYGMIEFSYVAVMFSANNWRKRMYWTMFLYIGWFFIAFFPKVLPLDDTTVQITRFMEGGRWLQIGMALGGLALIILFKYTWKPFKSVTWKQIGYMILIGVVVHFGMEISLLAAGIRPATDLVTVLVFNSLIEFNSGTPFLFIIWTLTKDTGINIGKDTEELIFEDIGMNTQNQTSTKFFEKKS
jgi:hypothetical protein